MGPVMEWWAPRVHPMSLLVWGLGGEARLWGARLSFGS